MTALGIHTTFSSNSASGGTSSAQTTQASGSSFIIAVTSLVAVSSVSDSKGNIYYPRIINQQYHGTFQFMSVFVCTGGAGGSGHTFTVNLSGTQAFFCAVVEFTGAVNFDQAKFTNGTAATSLAPPALTNAAGVLSEAMFAFYGASTAPDTLSAPTNGWTLGDQGSDSGNNTTAGWAYKIVTATQSQSTAVTAASSTDFGAAILGVFQPAAGGVFLNQSSNFANTAGTTLTVTYTPQAGNFLIFAGQYNNASSTTSVLSDGGVGNVFTKVTPDFFDTTDTTGNTFQYAANCKGGATTFTLTYGASVTFRGLVVAEYADIVAIPDPFDVASAWKVVQSPGTGSNGIVLNSMTPGQTPDTIIAFGNDNTGTSPPNAGTNITGYNQRASIWGGSANIIDVLQNLGTSAVTVEMTAASTDGSARFFVVGGMFRIQKPIWLHDVWSEHPEFFFTPRRIYSLYSDVTPVNPGLIAPQILPPPAANAFSQESPPLPQRGKPALENSTITLNLLESTLFGQDRVLTPPDWKYKWNTGLAAMPVALRSDSFGLNISTITNIQNQPPFLEAPQLPSAGARRPVSDYLQVGLNAMPLGQDRILYGPGVVNLNWDPRNPAPRLQMSEMTISGSGANQNILAFQATRPPISEANWTVPPAPRRNPQDFIGETSNAILGVLTTFAPFITEQFPNPYPRAPARQDYYQQIPGPILIPVLTQPAFQTELFPNPLPKPLMPRSIEMPPPMTIAVALSTLPPFQNEIFPNPLPKRIPFELYSQIQQIRQTPRPPPIPLPFWDQSLYPVPDRWRILQNQFRSRLGTEISHPIPLVAQPICNVVGLQVSQALLVLQGQGLQGVVQFVQNNTVVPGTVLSESPPAGTLPVSIIVTLTVAAGESLQQAIYNAVNAGLEPFVVYASSSVVPPDFVIAENPPIGTVVPVNSVVVITASNGPNFTFGVNVVPNVVGLTAFDARNALFAAGLSLGFDVWTPSPILAGLVLAQSVMAGSMVSYGTIVQLTLSQGPLYPSYSRTTTTVN